MSKLEQEKKAAVKAAAQPEVDQMPNNKKNEAEKKWQSSSFDEAFASAKPRKSRLEMDKEMAV